MQDAHHYVVRQAVLVAKVLNGFTALEQRGSHGVYLVGGEGLHNLYRFAKCHMWTLIHIK
jgi:hypothetical protein